MIKLFNIPNYNIDTTQFSNLLHDNIVQEFTQNFCNYIGVKYGCAVNSASSAIFLLAWYKKLHFQVPTMIPPVVLNSIINAGCKFDFIDDYQWVGHSYLLYNKDYRIIDSAQEVQPIRLYDRDIAIYSFYPTKPIGSCDGGMIVSNDKNTIELLKKAVYNGGKKTELSWNGEPCFTGWKMYMNSIQAWIANKNLENLDHKKEVLSYLREDYNKAFNLNNDSEHLYRIQVHNQSKFINYMKSQGVQCGIHYHCAHKMSTYLDDSQPYSGSSIVADHTVSIPFHECLSRTDIDYIIQCIHHSKMLLQK